MNLVLHDMDKKQFEAVFPDIDKNTRIICDNGNIKKCIGCFGCWIKTPGRCVIHDGYENTGIDFSKADNVIVISKCTYGGYSPFIKNVLDRAISYLLPSFEIRNNETHHKQRYSKTFNYLVFFYGADITEVEKATAEKLVRANSVNYHSKSFEIHFCSSPEALRGKVESL